VLVASSLALPTAHTQDDEPLDRTPRRCLAANSIESTRTIDNRTLLFFVRGDRIYQNSMPDICINLEPRTSFAYEASGGRVAQLCERDVITVEGGYTCRLGPFTPVSAEEVELLLENQRN
jgi:hypothetical protein